MVMTPSYIAATAQYTYNEQIVYCRVFSFFPFFFTFSICFVIFFCVVLGPTLKSLLHLACSSGIIFSANIYIHCWYRITALAWCTYYSRERRKKHLHFKIFEAPHQTEIIAFLAIVSFCKKREREKERGRVRVLCRLSHCVLPTEYMQARFSVL